MGNQSSSHGHGGSHHSTATSSSSHGHSTSSPSRLLRTSNHDTDLPNSTTQVDGGFLDPVSHLYAAAPIEYSRPVVHRLIVERKLAPFHLGLNDFESDWPLPKVLEALHDAEAQALANLREAFLAATNTASEAEVVQLSNPISTRKGKEAAHAAATAVLHRERLAELIKLRERRLTSVPQAQKEQYAKLYLTEATECPICFLYYPPPLVHTRCCDQPICTECFVQIKRADPTTTHLESEPAACPFCMTENFGAIYQKPTASTPSPSTPTGGRPDFLLPTSSSVGSNNSVGLDEVAAAGDSGFSLNVTEDVNSKKRRKSFAHTEKQVVTTDQIHPDWEAKVEAIKATVARRANRRIVFRQVGDRLIPVGITSGREADGANATMSTTALPPGFAAQVAAALDPSNGGSGREGRRATRRRNQEMAQYLESMGVNVGQDLEEMMVMEAMRLSLQEDEERQKKEKAEKDKAAAVGGATPAENGGEGTSTSLAVAETSAQGATGVLTPPGNGAIVTPGTPRTTASLMSDAIDSPMGSSTSRSRAASPLPLALPPTQHLSPTVSPPPAASRSRSGSFRSSSPSPSPSPSHSPSSFSFGKSKSGHQHKSSLSNAIAAVASKAASITNPESSSSIKGKSAALENGSIKRGLIGAGVVGAAAASGSGLDRSGSPSRSRSTSTESSSSPPPPAASPSTSRGTPQRLPSLGINDSSSLMGDMGGFNQLQPPITPSPSPTSFSHSSSTSTSTPGSPLKTTTNANDTSFSSLGRIESAASEISVLTESSVDEEIPLTPSQGYQELLDEDDD